MPLIPARRLSRSALTYAPSSYIARYEANNGFGMVHPSRHEDWRVRAIYAKRWRNEMAAVLEDCAKPSTEWDEAFDTFITQGKLYQNVVTSQWLHRLAARAQRRAA